MTARAKMDSLLAQFGGEFDANIFGNEFE